MLETLLGMNWNKNNRALRIMLPKKRDVKWGTLQTREYMVIL